MTKTPLIAFRCRPEALRAALDADAAVSAQSARDLGQEKLLLQMYVSDKFGS